MAVLNEDFAAIFDTTIQFELLGITRTVNDGWFTDSSSDEAAYKAALGVDPTRHLNVYTNDASGYLGYATFPAQSAGSAVDGIVMNWAYVGGRNLPGAGVYNLGRTLVHEVGHYLGLTPFRAMAVSAPIPSNRVTTLSTPGHTMSLITVPVAPLSVAV